MKLIWRIILIGVLIGFLVLVRQYEHQFFYDPMMAFFNNEYRAGEEIPIQWLLNLVFRFLLNTTISLGILYLSFQKWSVVKFSGVLYCLVFLLLFPAFIVLVREVTSDNYLSVFYVRRFLIHPLLLLLLIPAFFYQKMKLNKDL